MTKDYKGLSFKKDPPETGLAAMVSHPQTRIKIYKKECGYIGHTHWSEDKNGWRISIAVKDGDKWKWLSTKAFYNTEKLAREFVADFLRLLISKGYEFHYFED